MRSFKSLATTSVPPVVAPWENTIPSPRAHQRAAAQRRQHGIHGREGIHRGDDVDGHGAHQHGKEGGGQQVKTDILPACEKQRNIQHEGQNAHAEPGHQGIDDLARPVMPPMAT